MESSQCARLAEIDSTLRETVHLVQSSPYPHLDLQRVFFLLLLYEYMLRERKTLVDVGLLKSLHFVEEKQ